MSYFEGSNAQILQKNYAKSLFKSKTWRNMQFSR